MKNNLIIAKYIKIFDIVKRMISLGLGMWLLRKIYYDSGEMLDSNNYELNCWATYGDLVPRYKRRNP